MLTLLLIAIAAFLFACWLTPRPVRKQRKTLRPAWSPLMPVSRWRGEWRGYAL